VPWLISPGELEFVNLESNERIPLERVADLVDELLDTTEEETIALLVDLIEEERITVAEWKETMGGILKFLFIITALLGGVGVLRGEDIADIEARLSIQYGYLDRFAREIAAGELSRGQIERRARMYVNSTRQGFWTVLDRRMAEAGYTQERWYAIGDANTCSPCMEAGLEGWMPLGTYAEPGSGFVRRNPTTLCAGLTSCRCRKTYR